ncbi:13048_t:CDS:2, partial [Funneliformis geosporum]
FPVTYALNSNLSGVEKAEMMSNEKRRVYEEGTQDASFRRTWDKEEFKRRARERSRLEREKEEEEDRKRKGLKSKNTDSSEVEPVRELLRARTEKVVLDANLNKVQVVQSTNIASKQPGFHYQRALGMSMKVERSTLDQVKNKLENLKKKSEPQEYGYELL